MFRYGAWSKSTMTNTPTKFRRLRQYNAIHYVQLTTKSPWQSRAPEIILPCAVRRSALPLLTDERASRVRNIEHRRSARRRHVLRRIPLRQGWRATAALVGPGPTAAPDKFEQLSHGTKAPWLG